MEGKIFITGPGRSGTTFLVQLLTRLGCDTGFEPYNEAYIPEWRAGCEAGPDSDIVCSSHDVIRKAFDEGPRILKGPVWAYLLKYFLANELINIEHVVMPLRDLTESAHSRLAVGLDFMTEENFVNMPQEKNIEERQENILAMLAGKVVEACFLYSIPLTLIRFPWLVMDEEYCYGKVVEFERDIERERFGIVWRELANPNQIQFTNPRLVESKVGDTS